MFRKHLSPSNPLAKVWSSLWALQQRVSQWEGNPVIPISLASLEVKEEEDFGAEKRGQQLCHFPLNLSICCYGNPGAWCWSNGNCHPPSRCSRAGSGRTPAANSPGAGLSTCPFPPPGALISGRGSRGRRSVARRPRARAAQRRRKGRGGATSPGEVPAPAPAQPGPAAPGAGTALVYPRPVLPGATSGGFPQRGAEARFNAAKKN